MPRRPPITSILTMAAVAVAVPMSLAQAAVPNISVWSGKTKQHKFAVFLDQVAPGKAVDVSVTVSCKTPAGAKGFVSLAARKVPRNGKLTLTKKNADGAGGTLTISSSVLAKHAARGTVSYKLAAASGGCTGKDTFSLKYSVSHGG